jgi:hypothetical protein
MLIHWAPSQTLTAAGVTLVFSHCSPTELPGAPAGVELGAVGPTCTGPIFTSPPAASLMNMPGDSTAWF